MVRKKMIFKGKEVITVCISHTFSYTSLVEHHEEEFQLFEDSVFPFFRWGGMQNVCNGYYRREGKYFSVPHKVAHCPDTLDQHFVISQ